MSSRSRATPGALQARTCTTRSRSRGSRSTPRVTSGSDVSQARPRGHADRPCVPGRRRTASARRHLAGRAQQDALNKTLQILLDPGARNAEIAKSPVGSAMDQQVRTLAGSDALTQEFYVLAGQVLADLARSTGGDAQKMLQA